MKVGHRGKHGLGGGEASTRFVRSAMISIAVCQVSPKHMVHMLHQLSDS